MENTAIQFKTNINCSGCVASVKPHLDRVEGIYEWSVDTEDKDKILTVKLEGVTEAEVKELVRKAGFRIESVEVGRNE